MAHVPLNLHLLHLVNGFAGHAWLDSIVWFFGRDDVPRELILVVPYVFFWFSGKSDERRIKLLIGLFGSVLAVVVARLTAHFVPLEGRPMYDAASGFHRLAIPVTDQWNWNAFPSDTAAFSVALTLGLFRVQRTASLILTGIAMLFMGVGRIYLGFHYPIDVLAGWLIGAGCAAAAGLPPAPALGRALLRFEARSASLFYALAFMALAEICGMFSHVEVLLRVLQLVR